MIRRNCAYVVLFTVFAAGSEAQMRDRDAYGVWVRGRNYDVSEFPYRGVEIDFTWEEIQPSAGVFVWSDFDAALRKAANLGLYACVGIDVGPMSPAWLYERGVPKVMTTGHGLRSGPYPYYLDSRHIAYYYRLIEEFGRHVRGLPAKLALRVAFVQVKTGSTGDEEPYKGTPTPGRYAIAPDQWNQFRLGAFHRFHTAFQQGPGPVIPMLFNGQPRNRRWTGEPDPRRRSACQMPPAPATSRSRLRSSRSWRRRC